MRKNVLIVITEELLIFLASALPIMSTPSGGTESCTLVVRGFNLLEFSSCGIILFAAPILISTRKPKGIRFLYFIGVFGSIIYSIKVAHGWLNSVGNCSVTFNIGTLLLLSLLLVVLLFLDFDRLVTWFGQTTGILVKSDILQEGAHK